jgi:hypothetical protein
MKIRNKILTALAILLVLVITVQSALAYFTTYVTAAGSVTLKLGEQTVIEEPDVQEWTKHIVISAKEDSEPVWVRAKAFAPAPYELQYSGEGWTDGGDGYWYYNDIVTVDKSANELLVKIENIPEEVEVGENFNVIVIYEAVPAFEGKEADWSKDQIIVEAGE